MMLKLPVKIIEKLRNTIEWAIDRARSLLYDRHLDNTVLCVLYGVAKVMEKQNPKSRSRRSSQHIRNVTVRSLKSFDTSY